MSLSSDSAIDFGREALLTRSRCSRDEDRVIATNIAHDFRPATAIECEGDPLSCADRGFHYQQVWTCDLSIANEVGNSGQFPVAVPARVG